MHAEFYAIPEKLARALCPANSCGGAVIEHVQAQREDETMRVVSAMASIVTTR